MYTVKKRNRMGLDAHKRIDPTLPVNVLAEILSHYGMHAGAIERATGLSVSAIHYRNRKSGVKLRDYRNGEGVMAHRLLGTYNVRRLAEMGPRDRQKLRDDLGIG